MAIAHRSSRPHGSATPPSGQPPPPRKLIRVLAVALTVLIGFLCVEGILRVTRFAGPFGMRGIPDSVLGRQLRPGFRTWYRGEGEAFFTVNSAGMPDAERTVVKPPQTFRVAVVGDSFTEAAGIPRSRRYAAVLEQQLASCPAVHGQRVEVLSFGASGYGTAQELLLMRTQVWKYSPNVVLLQLFLGNDLRTSVRELSEPLPIPVFVPAGDSVELDSASRHLPGPRRTGWIAKAETFAFAWFRTLHLVQAVRVKWRDRHLRLPTTSSDVPDSTFGFEPGANWQIFLPPSSAGWKQAWDVTERLLGMMKVENEAAGIAFRVAAFPSAIQVHPDSAKRARFLERIGATSFDYPAARLADIAARHQISLLDLAPPMLSYAEQHHAPLYGFPRAVLGLGHWNLDGHRVGGETIGRWLCETLAPEGPGQARRSAR